MVEARSPGPEITQLSHNLRVLEYKPGASFDFPSQNFDSEEFSLNDISFVFEHGNKKLSLSFFDWPDSQLIHAQTKLERLDKRGKIPKDTTRVYGQAYDIMEQVAKYYAKPVMYLFYTKQEGLACWAQDKSRGASVFTWDSTVVADRFYNLKIFWPA